MRTKEMLIESIVKLMQKADESKLRILLIAASKILRT